MDSNLCVSDDGGIPDRPVMASIVEEGLRDQFLYRQLGENFIRFETMAYAELRDATEDYQGGLWEFYALSNGGFYIAPTAPAILEMLCKGNGYQGALSCDAAGIYATAMALSQLSFTKRGERAAAKYHLLRDFFARHREAGAIFRALD